MNRLTKEALQEIFDETSWIFRSFKVLKKGQMTIEIENWSPAGEDLVEHIVLTGTEESLPSDLYNYFAAFDPDEHAAMWIEQRGKVAGVPISIRELLNDADAIDAMYKRLYEDVKSIVSKRSSESKIEYFGYKFDPEYIKAHSGEFMDMLGEGYSPQNGFIQACNLHDVLNEYCSFDTYLTAEQILLRIYDDTDKVEDMLLNLKPGTKDADVILSCKDEIFGREPVMKIRIYQINADKDEKFAAFERLEHIEKIDPSIYGLVYEGSVQASDLEDIYVMFNWANPDFKRPEDFYGHSLSVSDIVAVQENDESWSYWYCDAFGFEQVSFDASKAEGM